MWNPDDLLADVVRAELTRRRLAYEVHGSAACTYLVLPLPGGCGEVAMSDVNSDLDGPLAEYSGLHAHYFPTGHLEGRDDEVVLFESPNLGDRRSPDRFPVEFAELLGAVEACFRLFAPRRQAAKRLREIAATETVGSRPAPDPAPARYRWRRGADDTVALSVTATAVMDAEAIAAKLYATFSKPFESGDPLPPLLTVQDVMQVLASEAAGCADGWHFWATEPGQDAWDTVHPWAEAQVRRLFPELTWPPAD
ncbi:hypothetical protein OG618_37850 (plasmid) [Kitasatospora sp. NBC_01246]|uniref:hypothetical protein n=1 Tax=Kitasatospora sp. NBC_01246 TaxID=2903570 RepID=UPI002E380F21|nr:hypothetical protein [Kitasatospora sp. NBC_01246]